MSGPLQGLKIVEMVGIGPGPFCAMMLADMGAEVIRIDQKKSGTKRALPMEPRFDVLTRGRRSLAIDLKKPGAVDTVLALVEQADAILEGFRPGVMERLGLGPEVCLKRNPKLVYGRMTGWGQTGPLAKAAGHDLNYISLTGALSGIGRPGQPPAVPLNAIGDFGGGAMMLAFGMVCALLEAQRSGAGQVVDAAMTDGAALLTSMMYGFYAAGKWTNRRGDNLLDGGAHFYDNYECADGKYISIGSIEPQFYALLLELAEIDDPLFQAQHDKSQWPELKKRIAAVFARKTQAEWCALMEGTDVCFAPILDWSEAPQHPHNKARETFIEVEGVVQPAPAPRMSRTPPSVQRPPAHPGEHTEAILNDWGIAPERIAALKAAEAI